MRLRLGENMMPYREHITQWSDLVTTYEATRAGFISIAFEKNIKATPFVEEAKSLKIIALKAKKPKDLLNLTDIYPSLLTASGLSDKSLSHLTKENKDEAIKNLIEKFLEPAGEKFIDELVYRFLLTRGDTLGGKIRNIAGFIGEKKLVRSIIASLSIKKRDFMYLNPKSKSWIVGEYEDLTIEENVKGLYWRNSKGQRTILFNITPSIVNNNVDICIFDCSYDIVSKEILDNPKKYIALGELKGGIDPAGADEHWKTANTALERIRNSFNKHKLNPLTFFIGSAIEKSMAKEIFLQLEKNILSNVANLTNDTQLKSIANWICEI